jgi:DNA polymerase I-like protein with 3'-5' exonuclease and polymerase domains
VCKTPRNDDLLHIVCVLYFTHCYWRKKIKEQQNLQSIWKEIDFLKERTLALESEVKGLKLQNDYLKQKVETLERQCAEHSVEVIILAYQNFYMNFSNLTLSETLI